MPTVFRISAAGLLLSASITVAQDAPKDQFGDPLPPGAVARLGTERMRDLSGLLQHPDGKHLFAVVNGTPSLIDPTTGLVVGKFGKGNRQYPTAISADGKRAAYYRVQRPDKGEAKTYFTAFDLTAGKVAGEAEVKSGYVSPVTAAAADGKSVLATSPGQPGLTVFDAATGQKGAEFGAVKLGVSTPPVFSADGKQVAIAFQNGYGSGAAAAQIRVYDWEQKKTRTTFQGHLREVRAMAFSPDGKLLATASDDTTVLLLWDLTKELKD